MGSFAGLRIVFDPALDGAGWPGPLGGQRAVFGAAWVGPTGLLGRLETELGLAALHPTPATRTAALVRVLGATAGFWSASFEADPFATARRLLADRDQLVLWGWRGQPVSERLRALWAVTADALPGVPDRLLRVLALLPTRGVDIETITVFDATAELPPLWRDVLVALAARGVGLEERVHGMAPARGDLAAARRSPFLPTGDGSLVLLRSQGPLAAAEEVAAALAACESHDGIVVVGADEILETALARHRVPRLGAAHTSPASTALVRLVLETAFQPMDPIHLHALLCVDPGPIPRGVARSLAGALGSAPARHSIAWHAALATSLDAIDAGDTRDPDRRAELAARVTALLDPVAPRDGTLSLVQITARLRVLATWARGRAPSAPTLAATAVLADSVAAMATLAGRDAFDRTALRRLLDEVEPPAPCEAGAEVGIASVASPGAVLGPARAVIWWSFTRDQAPPPLRARLTEAESASLRTAGIAPPDPGRAMAGEARRWRRPLDLATDALILVCPRTDGAGDRAHPHPLWDELTAGMAAATGADPGLLVTAQLRTPAVPRRARATLRPLLAPRATARIGAPITLRDLESPSSLEDLLACSVKWALTRRGGLHAGMAGGPGEPGPLLFGTLAHHVLEALFGAPIGAPDEVAHRAGALFDAGLATLAEALLLPDYQAQRAEVRQGVVASAREVATLIAKSGATVRGVEVELTGTLGGAAVAGRADLLLENPDVVVDFKWGATTYRKGLEAGVALQLVAYASMARKRDTLPGIAYLALRNQQLLSAACTELPGGRRVGSHTATTMLAGADASIVRRRAELARGELAAPSALEDMAAPGLAADGMAIAPKCQYCGLGTVCGRSVRT